MKCLEYLKSLNYQCINLFDWVGGIVAEERDSISSDICSIHNGTESKY